jgi:hypothetical protein
MKKAFLAIVAVALVALPVSAAAHQPRPLVKNAAKYCKSLRTQLGVATFQQTYGANHAFGKCVSKRVHELRVARKAAARACKQAGKPEDTVAFHKCVREKTKAETADDQEGVVNAAKVCAAERQKNPADFAKNYGTNHNKRNAFGKCVSQHAHDNEADDNDNEAQPGDDNNETGTKPDGTDSPGRS